MFMGIGFFQRWLWRLRLDRIEAIQSRLRKGLSPRAVWDVRLIDRLFPQDLKDQREAQAERRWRKDALCSLNLEAFRLRELLRGPTSEPEPTHEPVRDLE